MGVTAEKIEHLIERLFGPEVQANSSAKQAIESYDRRSLVHRETNVRGMSDAEFAVFAETAFGGIHSIGDSLSIARDLTFKPRNHSRDRPQIPEAALLRLTILR